MTRKFISFILAVLMVATLFTTSAFAAEPEGIASASIITSRENIPVYVNVPYAQTRPFISYCEFTNNQTLGQIHLADDARIHRVIFDFMFARSMDYDTGVGNIQLTIRVTNSAGQVVFIQTKTGENYNGVQFHNEFSASHNQTYTIWVDVSTASGVSSNGNYRSAEIYTFNVYTD